jgi:hypothetical protein
MKLIATALLIVVSSFSTALAQQAAVLGAPGTRGELAYPGHVQEGPDGNIYAYDAVDAFIKVYSPLGEFLRRMGGEGQGPGEITRRDGVSFGFTRDGRLFFTEYFRGHRWITLMKLSGELDSVVKIDHPASFGIAEAAALPEGRFLAEFHFSGSQDKEKDYYLYKSPISLRLVGRDGAVGPEVKAAEHRTRISYRPDGADTGLPFVPRFLWCLLDDSTVLFADGTGPAIEVIGLDGRPLRSLASGLEGPEKVRGRDLDAWREERKSSVRARDPDWYARFGSVIEKYTRSIYGVKPMLDDLAVTPSGNILVSGAWRPDRRSRPCALLDPDGRLLTRVDVPGSVSLTREFVFITASDEEGNTEVRFLKRSGDDRTDLLKFKAGR